MKLEMVTACPYRQPKVENAPPLEPEGPLIDSMQTPDLYWTAMKRIAAIGIAALLIWTLVPGLGEFLENAVHIVQEGHSAHAAPDGDHHDPPGPEHGCTGTLHLCSCCVSLSFLTAQAAAQVPTVNVQEIFAGFHAHLPSISACGVYHPPRA